MTIFNRQKDIYLIIKNNLFRCKIEIEIRQTMVKDVHRGKNNIPFDEWFLYENVGYTNTYYSNKTYIEHSESYMRHLFCLSYHTTA